MPATCPPSIALVAALALSAVVFPAEGAGAAEAILFDRDNCTGKYRMIDRSISDFDDIEFNDRVNSLMVITGSFKFYRDDDYEEDSGPSFLLGPSGYQDTCWSLQDASLGKFPVNRMSSAELIADTPAPQPKGIAILYEKVNFQGNYRILTRSVSNFDAIGFDNEVESVRVIKGGWFFYRDANFGAPPGRPAIGLAPGDYPDIQSLPDQLHDYFPRNLMSSAKVFGF
jgi:hypothetical protein